MRRTTALCITTVAQALLGVASARAQAIDLAHGTQVHVSSVGGFDWNQQAQTITFHDQARAIRGDVTVDADRLIAFYRKKQPAPGSAPQPANKPASGGDPTSDQGSNEIYRLEAIGHVHIYTQTDQAWGDHAVYDMDQAVLVMTGHGLKLTTPQDVLTARDVMEYHSQTRMSVGRGDATVTTNDGRRIVADVLTGFSAPSAPPATAKPGAPAPKTSDPTAQGASKLEKVYAWGHVLVRTQSETITGDRGVYVPDTSIARVVGHVHITRGQNQLDGAAAIINMKAGLATMTQAPGARVEGLVVPNEAGQGSDGKSGGQGGTNGGGAHKHASSHGAKGGAK